MMVEALVYFFVPALVGVLIGIASGLLGIGGGTVMVPIFRLAFGMSATMSTATSLFAIIPTSISGAISHVKGKTCIPALGIAADDYGWVQEAHPKLRPVETQTAGIYLAGTCQGPKDIPDTVAQASAAAIPVKKYSDIF